MLSLTLRLTGLVWDGGIGAHPDERYLVGTAEGLEWPGRMDPLAVSPAFPYGHVPLYLLLLIGGPDRLVAARVLSALFDTATVAVVLALGRGVGGRQVGWLAAAFVALMPLHVQQAHFGTVDAPLVFFTTITLFFAVRLAGEGRRRDAVWAGLTAGLAIGCKSTALLLALPLIAACWTSPGAVRERLGRGAIAAGMVLLAFSLTNPFALVRFSRFVSNVNAQSALMRGAVLAPYTIQYHATLPYVYPFVQQAVWGMGPGLALLCFGGLSLAFVRAMQRPPTLAGWVALAWALPTFAFIGGLFVKFPRYLLPLTPLLAVYGAIVAESVLCRRLWAGRVLVGLVLSPVLLLSLALVVSYRVPHPWVAASHWLETNVEPDTTIAVEAWDHPLPFHAQEYHVRTLPLFEPETEDKWAAIETKLAEADVVVIASRRGYGALAGWPERFPLTTDYYHALLDGELGFEVVACFGRWPRVGPLALADDPFQALDLPHPGAACRPSPVWELPPLDESFVVYDHPLVIVLRRK